MAIDHRIIKTNDAIRSAFVKLAQTMPLNKITVTALAENAHISRKTFYKRYPDMDALIESLKTDLLDAFRHTFIPISEPSASNDRQLMGEFVDFINENRDIVKLFYNLDDSRFLEAAHHDLQLVYQKRLAKGQQFSDTEAKTLAPWLVDFYTKGLSVLIADWVNSESQLSSETMVTLLMALFQPITDISISHQ